MKTQTPNLKNYIHVTLPDGKTLWLTLEEFKKMNLKSTRGFPLSYLATARHEGVCGE